jgi:hypothetical protein
MRATSNYHFSTYRGKRPAQQQARGIIMATRSDTANALIALLQDRPVAYHPMLAKILGGVKQAIFVSQLLYWHGKGIRPDGFIWKTREEFQEETGLTRYEQETARKHLRDLGVLEEKRKGVPGKMHYRLDTGKLGELIVEHNESTMLDSHFVKSDKPTLCKVETPQCITESTSESTDKNPDAQGAVSSEQERKADILDFFDGAVPETPAPGEKPKPDRKDAVDHDYLEPYQVFCGVIGRDPSTVGEHKTAQWLKRLGEIAVVSQGSNGSESVIIQPDIMAQAIKAIRDDWSFTNKKWRTPYNSGFAELVELTACQIMEGTHETQKTLEVKGRYQ